MKAREYIIGSGLKMGIGERGEFYFVMNTNAATKPDPVGNISISPGPAQVLEMFKQMETMKRIYWKVQDELQ